MVGANGNQLSTWQPQPLGAPSPLQAVLPWCVEHTKRPGLDCPKVCVTRVGRHIQTHKWYTVSRSLIDNNIKLSYCLMNQKISKQWMRTIDNVVAHWDPSRIAKLLHSTNANTSFWEVLVYWKLPDTSCAGPLSRCRCRTRIFVHMPMLIGERPICWKIMKDINRSQVACRSDNYIVHWISHLKFDQVIASWANATQNNPKQPWWPGLLKHSCQYWPNIETWRCVLTTVPKKRLPLASTCLLFSIEHCPENTRMHSYVLSFRWVCCCKMLHGSTGGCPMISGLGLHVDAPQELGAIWPRNLRTVLGLFLEQFFSMGWFGLIKTTHYPSTAASEHWHWRLFGNLEQVLLRYSSYLIKKHVGLNMDWLLQCNGIQVKHGCVSPIQIHSLDALADNTAG